MEIIHGGVNLGEFLKNDYKQWLEEGASIIKNGRGERMDQIDPLSSYVHDLGFDAVYADSAYKLKWS